MGPQVIHNGSNLIVTHHGPECRHTALSVDDDRDRISAGSEISIGRERGIGCSPDRTFTVRHVAGLTNTCEQFLAAGLGKPEACAQGWFMLGVLCERLKGKERSATGIVQASALRSFEFDGMAWITPAKQGLSDIASGFDDTLVQPRDGIEGR
jgi:hypothetical protein